MFIMIFSLLLAFSHAAIEDFGVSGFYSDTDLSEEVTQSSGFYHIYSGFINDADFNCDSDGNGTEEFPCNTCDGTFSGVSGNPPSASTGTEVHVCNARALRVLSGEDLTISFRSTSTGGDDNGRGRHILTPDKDDESQLCKSNIDIDANTVASITNCQWSDICNEAEDGITDCKLTKPSSKIFRVGKDLNNDDKLVANDDDFVKVKIHVIHSDYFNNKNITDENCSTSSGICTYTMFPGDKKAFFDSTKESSNLPTLDGDIEVKSVRVYYQEFAGPGPCNLTTAQQFGFGSTQFEDFNVSDASAFSLIGDPAVTGLENNKWYCFRTAIVDETGFVSGITAASSTTYTGSAIFTSEVNGLLEKGNCFIATAAFGSAVDKRLDIFRSFRDQILNSFWLGRSFVKAYYQHSKPLAIWIAENPLARHIVQILLWPLVALAYLFLHPFYLFSLVLLLVGIATYKKRGLAK